MHFLHIQCYTSYMLLAAGVYGTELWWYVLYSRAGPVILGPAESTIISFLGPFLVTTYK